MTDDDSTGWVDVGVNCGPFVVALTGVNPYLLTYRALPDYATAVNAARDMFARVGATLTILATNGIPVKLIRGTPQLTVLDQWVPLDTITPESYASNRRTTSEYAAWLAGQVEGLAQVFGEDTVDESYRLVCDASGACTVLADINEDGDLTPDTAAGGRWTFRVGGVGDFDAPGASIRTYTLPVGTLIEAQDADGETPTLHTRTVATMPPPTFDDFFPHPVDGFLVGMLRLDDDGVLHLATGTRTDIDGPFGGRDAYIGEELPYGSGINFSGSTGAGSVGIYAEFGRPRTPLLDDDGAAVGQFFVGVEVVATQCRRHTGWVEQADQYAEPISGDTEFLITSGDFPQSDALGGFGPANVDNYPVSGTPPQYYLGDKFPPEGDAPSVGGLARCGGFARILAYNSEWPTGHAPGGRFANASDPHHGLIGLLPHNTISGTLAGTPPVPIVGNPFQWIATTYRARAVYITRTRPGAKPNPTDGDTRGKGGVLTYSQWSSEQTFTYCPATNSCVHVESSHFDFHYAHASETVTVGRYQLLYNDNDQSYTPFRGYDVKITGQSPPDNAAMTMDFNDVPNAAAYRAVVTRTGGTRATLLNSQYVTAPPYVFTGLETQPKSWNIGKRRGWAVETIKPGGEVGLNGAKALTIAVAPIIKAYKNGSRNAGTQCPAVSVFVSNSEGGDQALCFYSIAGGIAVSQATYTGWDGTVIGFDNFNVIGATCGGSDGKAEVRAWKTVTSPPYDKDGNPIKTTTSYVPIKPYPNGDNMYPFPLGRPEPMPGGDNYDAHGNWINSSDPFHTHEFSGPPWQGCTLGEVEHVLAWKGHVQLWIAKHGQPLPKFPASAQTVQMADGSHAYWAASIIDGGLSVIRVDNVVGYNDEELIEPFKKISDFLQALINALPGPVRQRVEDRIGKGTIGAVLVDPVLYDGPFLCYINSDTDLFNQQVEVAGLGPGAQNFVGFPPVAAPVTGPVFNPTGLLGTISYMGATIQVYDRPQLKA